MHSRFDPAPLIDDGRAERLVDAPQREALRREALARLDPADPHRTDPSSEVALFEVLRASPAFANVILRTRYPENALQRAIGTGTRDPCCSAPASTASRCGSRLAFPYLETRAFAEPSEPFRQIQARVNALGEPFLSGF